MKKLFVNVWILLLIGLVFAQDPNDPGIKDSVFFSGIQPYVCGQPYLGHIKVDVQFYNDEDLVGIEVPLSWSGPIVFDSGTYQNTRVNSLSTKILVVDTINSTILIQVGAIPPGPDHMNPGKGKLVTLFGTVTDTGIVRVDTTSFGGYYLRFVPELATEFVPVFKKLELTLHSDSIIPGDVNGDWRVTLEDIIGLVCYIFRGMPLALKPAGDVNASCTITLGDVIYLVNYIFRSGIQPVTGCACD